MTTDKAFKRVVRARMAKTGERYAAARRTLQDDAVADPNRQVAALEHGIPPADMGEPKIRGFEHGGC